jgi:hypothetical protein
MPESEWVIRSLHLCGVVRPVGRHVRIVPTLPSGTVTFLFTDLEVRRGCRRNIPT